jgi:SAM-dependent methyltransferase
MRSMIFHVDDDAYDRFMGRYSKQLAPLFADFAGVGSGARVLDVGAGPGALAATLATRVGADHVAAAEPSPEFVAALGRRLPGIDAREAPAEELPWEDESFDAVLGQLVISFVADATAATAEMRRVARPGGVVALCMWTEEGLELAAPMRAAREAAAPPDAPPPPQLPFRSEDALGQLLSRAGLRDVETAMLEVQSEYASFDEFWDVARGMTGPDTAWMGGLDEEQLAPGRDAAHRFLGSPEGAFVLRARAACARAVRA